MLSCPRCFSPYSAQMDYCGIDGSPLRDYSEDPLIGRDLDRYQIVQHLGDGAMARVYRVRHRVLGREHAVKVLFGEIASNKILAERFRREAQAASKIDHENVVTVMDFGTTAEGLSFLIMELVQGQTLRTLIKSEGPFEIERTASIARQLASGLAEAHRLGFVHRDLKPSNIMLVGSPGHELVKILDFGLVRAEEPGAGEAYLTKTGQFLGTPIYMSPEQIIGAEIDQSADLYSLGVVMFEMLEGRPPFRASNLGEIRKMHLTAPPPPVRAANGLEVIVHRLLAKAPEDRPKSADVVVELIDRSRMPLGSAVPEITLDDQIEDTVRTESPVLAPHTDPGFSDQDPTAETERARVKWSDSTLRVAVPVTVSAPIVDVPPQDEAFGAALSSSLVAFEGDASVAEEAVLAVPVSRGQKYRPLLAGLFVMGATAFTAWWVATNRADEPMPLATIPIEERTHPEARPAATPKSPASDTPPSDPVASKAPEANPTPGLDRDIPEVSQKRVDETPAGDLETPTRDSPDADAKSPPPKAASAPPPRPAPRPSARARLISGLEGELRRALLEQRLTRAQARRHPALAKDYEAWTRVKKTGDSDAVRAAHTVLLKAIRGLVVDVEAVRHRLSKLSSDLARASNSLPPESLRPLEDRYLELAKSARPGLAPEAYRRLWEQAAVLERDIRSAASGQKNR